MAVKKSEEKEQLREEWKEFLGIDVFYPYYKVKEVQKAVANKTTVKFFDFKGKAEFWDEDTKSLKYIFKKKF